MESSSEQHTASTLTTHGALLGTLIGLLRDLALSEAASSRRLGVQVVLPALCSLLGPSLHHEELAAQLTEIFEAAGHFKSEGEHRRLFMLLGFVGCTHHGCTSMSA